MENKQKNKLGLGILIGVLIGLFLGLGAFIIYDKVIDKDKKENVVDNKKNDGIDKDQSNGDDVVTDFDLNKVNFSKPAINGMDNVGYNLADNEAPKMGLGINLNNDKKSATVTIDWSKYFEIYGISATTGETRNYKITNFEKEISDVYVSGFGQESGYETAFYIMKDGTVEYTPINNALGNNGSSASTVLKSYGQVDGVSGIVKVVSATDYGLGNSDESYIGGSYVVLAVKADGTFYDISKILYESYSDYYK